MKLIIINDLINAIIVYTVDNLEYKEVMMQGGGVHSVPITIEKCGTAIAWEFSTEPKGLAFGIVYKPTSDSSKEDEVRLVCTISKVVGCWILFLSFHPGGHLSNSRPFFHGPDDMRVTNLSSHFLSIWPCSFFL